MVAVFVTNNSDCKMARYKAVLSSSALHVYAIILLYYITF